MTVPALRARAHTALDRVGVGTPVFLHGSSDGLEAARHWLNARGCHVLGYVDVRPPVTIAGVQALDDVDQVAKHARIGVYGVGRDGVHFVERLAHERPDVRVIALVDDRGTAAVSALAPGAARRLIEALPPPVPLATFAAAAATCDLLVVASTNHGTANLARAAAAGVTRLGLLRFGFAPPSLTSFALDWALAQHPDAAFVLSENAQAEVWDALDHAAVGRVFTAALWSFVAAPLATDEPLLAALADGDPMVALDRMAAHPAFAALLHPARRAEPPSLNPLDVPPALQSLLQSFFARVVVPGWATEAPTALAEWTAWLAHLPTASNSPPERAALLTHAVRAARHLGNYPLAETLLASAPTHPALARETAGVLLDRGRCAEALTELSALHAADPTDPDVAYLLAGTALLQQRRGLGDNLPTATLGLVERLQAEAASARDLADSTADVLPERLTRIGFGVVRGALDRQTVAELLALYREIFDRLDGPGRAALAMGTALTAAQVSVAHEGLRRAGVLAAIETYLGGPPRFVADGSYNRHRRGVPASGLCVYHQDGRIGNRLTREVTCWVPLVACGRHAPGVELVARRFFGFFPLGDGHPSARRAADLLPNDLIVPGTTITPAFEAGDVLVFDKFTPHRTQPLPPADLHGDGERFSMDLRWYSDRWL
jgi:hypothetical protein